ncbi:hypothetical protein QAD02_005073 [Eretmocerus hayati]|uniref:Uncharacterized protein n=1 Tax=Eretmocerus hayati TaxID=131215 RepID=A0ACC2NT91_9HYME|nr:hypothetical protein QAD02_005073 [Eretmocerus hayati]
MPSLSPQQIQTVVHRALGSDTHILDYRLEPFTKQKNGILGMHYLLTVRTNRSQRTYSYFLKTPAEASVIRDMMGGTVFSEEIHFYKHIQPLLIANYNIEKWSPSCYLADINTLVLEDLRAQGFSISVDWPLNGTLVRSALSSLARFHASSILVQMRLGPSFKSLYSNAIEEKVYTNLQKFRQINLVGYETVALMAGKLGLDSSLVQKVFDRAYENMKPEEGKCNVLCHSDLWKNNLMFDKSVPPRCVLVDYQMLKYASPALDVGMLLYVNTTPEFRKEFEGEMLEHYYSTFCTTLLTSDLSDQVQIPSYDSMLKDYHEKRLIGITYAAFFLPSLYLSVEDLSMLLNNPAELEKWLFRNRFDLISAHMDVDPLYKNKMKDIVTELIEEGKRVLGDG